MTAHSQKCGNMAWTWRQLPAPPCMSSQCLPFSLSTLRARSVTSTRIRITRFAWVPMRCGQRQSRLPLLPSRTDREECSLREWRVIAIVDDDESVRKAVVLLLQVAGHRARAYASGQEFLENW